MKTLEIIITILVCFVIMFFVVRQSKIYNKKTESEKILFQELKKKYKQGELKL
jgi:uncharacterized membrane protein